MGGGKGSVEGWVAVVKRGRIILELGGVDEERAREALRRASHKLPIKTRIVSRHDFQLGTTTAAAGGEAE